ncbi:hypothetical protein SEA_CAELUM_79 [Streptomyces phage Caelum]|uniref:Uncharacterized protein n=1 Tax=Streptomyces phage Caelum TaxID=2530160 RepID=A0A481W0J3_9CAUD|nr:hypothetical protein KGG86_gp79 [Streptomyces phage Caelum]QBI99450.1 hypothetical protein SEA_CAELUM_79 [Streptomyces phage Caelum]
MQVTQAETVERRSGWGGSRLLMMAAMSVKV